jgi:hypothetical protein
LERASAKPEIQHMLRFGGRSEIVT